MSAINSTNRAVAMADDVTKLNSIDILEECLNSIHRCRRNSLIDKLNRHQKGGYSSNRGSAGTGESNTSIKNIQSNGRQKARVDNQKHLTPSVMRADSAPFKESHSSISLGASSTTKKENSSEPNIATSSSQSSGGDSKKSDVELQAEKALSDMRKEIISWASKNHLKVEDEDERADFADYLTDKYLCGLLDPMPASTTITAVRKQVSIDLDAFVSVGPSAMSTTIPEPAFSGQTIKAINEKVHSSAIATTGTKTRSIAQASKVQTTDSSISVNSSARISDSSSQNLPPSKASDAFVGNKVSNNSVSPLVTKMTHSQPQSSSSKSSSYQDAALKKIEDKKALEKAKIKEQYEKYRQLKANSEEMARSDTVKLAEENLDDIRSLLTSIQSSSK